jgi:hypothetical protein
VLVSSLVIALPWGLIGYAWALLFTELVRNISYGILMNKILKVNMYEYSEIYIPSLSVAAIVFLSIFGIKSLGDTLNLPMLVTLLLEMIMGGVGLALGVWFLPTSVLKSRLISLMSKLKLNQIKNPLIKKAYTIYSK